MIQIGVLLSFSGTTSVTERSHHRAIYSALYDHSVPHISAAVPVELIVRDMQCSPAVCAAQVRQMAQRGIKIFMGIVTAASLKAIRPILDQYNCLLFCFTTREEQPILAEPINRPLLPAAQSKAAASLPDTTVRPPFAEQHQCSVSLLLDALTAMQAILPLTWLGYLRGKTYASSLGHTCREFITDVCRQIHKRSNQPDSVSSVTIEMPGAIDWQGLLEIWSEKSQEYVVAVGHDRSVLFANRRAAERFEIQPGMVLDEQWEEQLAARWSIERQETNRECWQSLLIIRPRAVQLAQSATEVSFPAIKTNSPRYQLELQSARIAAHSLTNTLLLGETGSGKEVLARAIHNSSMRKHGPFISVNIAALPRELVASELFGYCDGAFTGAKKGGQIGKFEAANGGTLFLDEIGELPLDFQVVLLRVLEERKVTRLGGHDEKPLDVRIVAATNRILAEEVSSGRFRADLYYRLNVLQIRIPPLRERKEDIAPLALEFLKQLRAQYGAGPTGISMEAHEALLAHSWPGNIRELRNTMERAFLLAVHEPMIWPGHLPAEWNAADDERGATIVKVPLLRDMERQTIRQAIAATSSLSAAAKKLGIARSTLYRKMAELEMGQEGTWPVQKQGRNR